MTTTKSLRALLAGLLLCSGVASGQEMVSVRRLADTVSIRRGPARSEHILYYFASSADLAAGDELEQGSSGHSEIALSGGGLVELHMQAHVIISRLDPQGDVLRFPWLTLAHMTGGERPLICELPGGVACRLQQTQMEVRVEPGRIRVRNRGSQPIAVRGVVSIERGSEGDGILTLGQGQEAYLPIVRYLPEPPGAVQDDWNDLVLRHGGGFALEPSGPELLVRPADDPEAPPDDVLTVGGVRTRVAGQTLHVTNHRRPVPEGLSVVEILTRITGNPNMTPEAVQAGLRLATPEELRAAGAALTAEQDAEAARQRGQSGEKP